MYICQNCLSNIPANQPSFNYTTQTRSKHYPKRPGVHAYIDVNGKQKLKDDPGGIGQEIAKEIRVCKHCLDLLRSKAQAKR